MPVSANQWRRPGVSIDPANVDLFGLTSRRPRYFHPDTEDHPHTECVSWQISGMPSLDKAFSEFLKAQRGNRSYASLALELGVAESTLHRLINLRQSATLRSVERVMQKLEASPAEVFGVDVNRRRGRRG